MLYVRHTVGSRLFFETDEFEIKPVENGWEISFTIDREAAAQILKFHDELNIFHAVANEKTWYYSSEGKVEFIEPKNKLIIIADHKTIYPV